MAGRTSRRSSAARTVMVSPPCAAPVCHQKANFDPGRVPGHPEWHLAPREMAWEGKTLGEICEQIKDPKRNGNRKVEELIHHIGQDTLVGWAWAPGLRPSARSRHAEASRRAGRGVGENRRGVSELDVATLQGRTACDERWYSALLRAAADLGCVSFFKTTHEAVSCTVSRPLADRTSILRSLGV